MPLVHARCFFPAVLLLCGSMVLCPGVAHAADARKAAAPLVEFANARGGHVLDDLKDENGVFIIHYAMYAPTVLPKKRSLGLIIAFHGNGHVAETDADVWSKVLSEGKLENEYVVMSLKSQGKTWESADNEKVDKAFEWVLANYPIDRRRVHTVGFSAGAYMSSKYGVINQDRLASVSMYCGGTAPRVPPNGGYDMAPTLYLHLGQDDGFVPLASGLRTAEGIKASGFRNVVRVVRGMGHSYGPADTVCLDDLRMMDQLRCKHIPLEPEQEAFVRSAIKDARSAEAVWADPKLAALALNIGGQYALAIAAKANRSKNPTVRLNIAKAVANGLFGADALRLMADNLQDKSAALRQASIAALAPAANWNWPEAKELLLRIANDAKATSADRCAATKALVDATVMIGLADKYMDNTIIPGLVGLLASPDAAVRSVACNGLAERNPVTYDYNPAAKDNKKAIAAWQAWATEKCGDFKEVPLK